MIAKEADVFLLGKLGVKGDVYSVCVIFPKDAVVKMVEKFRSAYSLNTLLHSDFSSSGFKI